MISQKSKVPTSLGSRSLAARVPAIPWNACAAITCSKVIVRFRENTDKAFEEKQQKIQDMSTHSPTDTRLSPEQLQEVYTKEPGNISPRMAELRADMGDAVTDLSQLQTFDGPAPETICGRLAMIGVLLGLGWEWTTGLGLQQQVADHPITVFMSFVILSIATYVPLVKGYTRKEPFANSFLGLNWTPKAENWNGRLAMLSFTGMIFTEAISGVNTLQAWGLQPTSIPGLH